MNLQLIGKSRPFAGPEWTYARAYDVEMASLVYGASRVRHAMSCYRRAGEGDPGLMDDFLKDNQTPSTLRAWPTSLAWRRAELYSRATYFPTSADLASWDRVCAPSPLGMSKSTSPGYWIRTYARELGVNLSSKKSDPQVTALAENRAIQLWNLAQSGAGRDVLQSTVVEQPCYFSRLLSRRAIAKQPKVRSVYDASYACNLIAARTSLPLVDFIRGMGSPYRNSYSRTFFNSSDSAPIH